jgi:hypothetical protein
MLIISLDYKGTANPLSSTADARNMQDLARACSVWDVKVLTDERGALTKDMAAEALAQNVQACRKDDYFVFYYSGHGTRLGKDDAYCFQDSSGQVSAETCMTDDEFSAILTANCPKGVNVILLSDCCHSDTIADFQENVNWSGHTAMSLSGCLDMQTSGDTGHGGIFTQSMLTTIAQLCQAREPHYSVGHLYNGILRSKVEMFGEKGQSISQEHTMSTSPDSMRWPLIPIGQYVAPLSRS